MIKAIIFDCFGVLTADLWKEFVATLPEHQKPQAREINHIYDAGHITEQTFLDRIESLTGKRPGEVERISLGKRDTNKNIQLLAYIKSLRPRYKVGMLSNIASNWVRDTFLTVEEQKLFDNMVFSYEVGMTKPDTRIFKLACEKLEVGTSETIFVDDIESYCDAARTIGMKAVVYHDFNQMQKELEKILADSKN